MKTLLLFICIILVYIILGKSQTVNCRVILFVFKSESPAAIAVFHIQAFVYPTQFLQNLSFPNLAGAKTQKTTTTWYIEQLKAVVGTQRA